MKLRHKYDELLQLPPREKYQRLKSVAYGLEDAIDTLEFAEYDLAMTIINQAIKISGFPQKLTKIRTKLIQKKLDSLGITLVTVLKKHNQEVSVEAGTIIVGDPEVYQNFNFQDFSEKELITYMTEKRGLIFGTGGDGVFNTQLRIVDSPEPVLSKAEYKLMAGSTDAVRVYVKSGRIAVADLHDLVHTKSFLKLEPGLYKVCAYLFDNKKKFRSFYIVLTRTKEDSKLQSINFYTLE